MKSIYIAIGKIFQSLLITSIKLLVILSTLENKNEMKHYINIITLKRVKLKVINLIKVIKQENYFLIMIILKRVLLEGINIDII